MCSNFAFYREQHLINVGSTNHIEYNYTNIKKWPNVCYINMWFEKSLESYSNLYAPMFIKGVELRFINCTHYYYEK